MSAEAITFAIDHYAETRHRSGFHAYSPDTAYARSEALRAIAAHAGARLNFGQVALPVPPCKPAGASWAEQNLKGDPHLIAWLMSMEARPA